MKNLAAWKMVSSFASKLSNPWQDEKRKIADSNFRCKFTHKDFKVLLTGDLVNRSPVRARYVLR